MRDRDEDWFEADEVQTAPGVVFWFRVYCVGLILFALVIFAAAYLFTTLPVNPRKPEDEAAWIVLVILYAVGGLLCLVTGIIPLLLPRRPWVWIVDLVVICLGLTGGCTIIPCVFLLIYWLKPETRRYFGRD